jgi:hypothetical protein
MGAVGNRLVALGLIGVIAATTSCSRGGTGAASPTTVLRRVSPTAPSAPGAGDSALLRTVRWSGVAYPMDCGASGTVDVRDVEYATTPPSALFVYETTAKSAQPRLLQALVNYTDGWLFYVFRTSVDVVTAAVAGYSNVDVGTSTPDVSATLKWIWQGGSYRLVSSVPSHARFCVTGPCAPTAARGGS